MPAIIGLLRSTSLRLTGGCPGSGTYGMQGGCCGRGGGVWGGQRAAGTRREVAGGCGAAAPGGCVGAAGAGGGGGRHGGGGGGRRGEALAEGILLLLVSAAKMEVYFGRATSRSILTWEPVYQPSLVRVYVYDGTLATRLCLSLPLQTKRLAMVAAAERLAGQLKEGATAAAIGVAEAGEGGRGAALGSVTGAGPLVAGASAHGGVAVGLPAPASLRGCARVRELSDASSSQEQLDAFLKVRASLLLLVNACKMLTPTCFASFLRSL